jgi:hypothetical protein
LIGAVLEAFTRALNPADPKLPSWELQARQNLIDLMRESSIPDDEGSPPPPPPTEMAPAAP